jgi:hypothetical protein
MIQKYNNRRLRQTFTKHEDSSGKITLHKVFAQNSKRIQTTQ